MQAHHALHTGILFPRYVLVLTDCRVLKEDDQVKRLAEGPGLWVMTLAIWELCAIQKRNLK
jgi:hypothetical protein